MLLPLFSYPLSLFVDVHIIRQNWTGRLYQKTKDGRRRHLNSKRVRYSENAIVWFGQQFPREECFPPTMEPVKIANVVSNKNCPLTDGVF